MKDEIKEILDYLKDNTEKDMLGYVKDKLLSYEESKLLLDYITILQQDTEMYAQLKDEYEEEIKDLQQENERLERLKNTYKTLSLNNFRKKDDYQTRCEKAFEYIDKQKKKMYKSRNKIAMFILMKLENILQNGSDSQ